MVMTAGELRELLGNYHPDTEVILSNKYGENFWPLRDVEDRLMSPEEKWPIHEHDLHLHEDSTLTSVVVLEP